MAATEHTSASMMFMSSDELLARSRVEAERATVPVRAAARMRIARVETVFDRGQARITFEMGLDEARGLRGRARQELLSSARLLAAAVEPKLLREIPSERFGPAGHERGMLVNIMLQHNFVEAAFDYVTDGDSFGFPFGFAVNLIHKIEDESQRVAVVRRAVEAWRGSRDEQDRMSKSDFLRLFGTQWRLLSAEEARELLQEMVGEELERPDELTSAGYPDGIAFTSRREHTLFELLHVLRHLDPSLAESLIGGHEQLARAARRFPKGRETMIEEDEERRRQMIASGQSCEGGFVMSGDPRDMPYMQSMLEASRDGNFEPAIGHTLEKYREDTNPENPNEAPKAVWPSTASFRSILYRAGKRLGSDAAAYLVRIPDDDLRLFARIELAAALAGLPEMPGVQMRRRRPKDRPRIQGEPMLSPDGRHIRCPECKWKPSVENRWGCKCGHAWNTFLTGGLCPRCEYQWTETTCLACTETSPHADWYGQG
jgi:hypothetical protein